jgi:lipopolysaccharide transport system ATP-binding protein
MDGELLISAKNLSKAYRIWSDPAARLFGPLMAETAEWLPGEFGRALRARAHARYRDFFALRDVSFEVRRGEAVGIVGRNGAGKSTLLQIIAGTLQPSSGTIRTAGRVGALLELGSGFNPEFTGRENVYLNAAVLGLSRRQAEAKFSEIEAFAEIGAFIDQPVKIYSSGMMMRLAFAVQTAIEPDLLIVDEALSVGDAPFQAKCFARLKELQRRGCSFLFVSHDIGTIRTLCHRALFLAGGKIMAQGESKAVCDAYQIACLREQGIVSREIATPDRAHPAVAEKAHEKRNLEFDRHAARQRAGSGRVRFVDCYMLNRQGNPTSFLEFEEPIQICWLVEASEKIHASVSIGVTFKTLKGVETLSATDKVSELVLSLEAGQRAFVTMPLSLPLRSDRYYFTSSLFRFPENEKYADGVINFPQSELIDLVEYSYFFEVTWNRPWAHYGPVQRDSVISITPMPLPGPT